MNINPGTIEIATIAGAPTGKLPAATERDPGVFVGLGGMGVEESAILVLVGWLGIEIRKVERIFGR